jgi:hypothetical protein
LSYYSDSGTIFGPIAWAIVGFAVIFSSIQSMLLLKKQDIMSGNLKDVLPRLHQIRKRERGSLLKNKDVKARYELLKARMDG